MKIGSSSSNINGFCVHLLLNNESIFATYSEHAAAQKVYATAKSAFSSKLFVRPPTTTVTASRSFTKMYRNLSELSSACVCVAAHRCRLQRSSCLS